MSTILLIAAAWFAILVLFLGVLWADAARQCRAGRHHLAWEFGRWVCTRCGYVDYQATEVDQ